MTDKLLMHNVTGAELSPKNLKEAIKATEMFPPDVSGDQEQLKLIRSKRTREALPIGSIPLPTTVKGVIKASFNKLLGNAPELFLDKLGERLAFERSGVRLYEAALAKAVGLKERPALIKQLEHIRDEEAEHMAIVKNALEKLGADPTAITPSADVAGVMGIGLIQVISDPRTDISQVLNTLLNAELIDNAAWELLIELANSNGQSELSKQFEKALIQEQEHLLMIKTSLKDYLDLA